MKRIYYTPIVTISEIVLPEICLIGGSPVKTDEEDGNYGDARARYEMCEDTRPEFGSLW